MTSEYLISVLTPHYATAIPQTWRFRAGHHRQTNRRVGCGVERGVRVIHPLVSCTETPGPSLPWVHPYHTTSMSLCTTFPSSPQPTHPPNVLRKLIHTLIWHLHYAYPHTVYPIKYAHGFCFAVLCCGYTLKDFPISIRLTSLALWQSNDCPSASKATLMNMDKYFMWIHYERLHNHNKAKHNKTVCIFLGIYCTSVRHLSSITIKIPDVTQTH